ncbi:nuclear transport factor 2 family protein [Spiractinospora alimapuensis]|uniref:nuclear transport factor 2 family protein n=1 Tax=Spiractinospora alimapuensis TaxID=2820884 RepID=UPI001F445355|nr:nuclear transport factor 2 family protein [Spiractinospora alimapuensis]QVQ54167.1 nuclear transport factor 2 family protein [Spiractinospora alimapuensis]
MTAEKTDTDVFAAYISVWNERESHARRTIGAEVFTPDACYVDPNTSSQGRDAIDIYIAAWQARFPNFAFILGTVRCHHEVAHFRWSFGPPGGPSAATGEDVVVIEQGRLSRIYGFFD